MIDDLRIRNRSAHTIKVYIACVAHFARHFGKSPELLGPEEIRQYQVYLVNERRVSWSYLNQTVCALRFLYCVTLERDWAITRIPRPRQPQRLPVVISEAEVKRFFDSIRKPKYLALLMTASAAGLRTSEVCNCASRTSTPVAWRSASGKAKGRRTATSCSLPLCSRY
jgi:integrase